VARKTTKADVARSPAARDRDREVEAAVPGEVVAEDWSALPGSTRVGESPRRVIRRWVEAIAARAFARSQAACFA